LPEAHRALVASGLRDEVEIWCDGGLKSALDVIKMLCLGADRVGFATLAVFWLFSGTRAYLAIRRGNVQEHRRWMLRNYALTFGAATLRIQLPLLIISGVSFPVAYTMVAWLSWVPNWLAVEAWLRARQTVAAR